MRATITGVASTRRAPIAIIASLLTVALLVLGRAQARSTDPWKDTARYRFEYRVSFSRLQAGGGTNLRVWIPYPKDTRDQKVLAATVESPWSHTIESDQSGNRIVYIHGKGIPERDLVMRFEIERHPSDGVPAASAVPNTPLDPNRYLRPARLIPLGGTIRELATKESRSASTDAEKIRAFYDYVIRTMRYNKSGFGWGRGDAIWACDHKRGNCTDFHSLLIGMARSQKIPARFIIGFPVPRDVDSGSIGGYHCWAELFERGRGWIPVDASEASKTGKPDEYFGVIPNDRIEFTAGRDLVLTPAQKGPPLNYFIYPYAEADGKVVPVSQLQARFRFERPPARP